MAINEKLDRAVGGLFEASMGERPWSAALTALGECFAGGVYLMVFDAARQAPVLAMTCNRISPMADADYEQHYGAIDPRRALVVQRPIGEVLACHEHFDATFVRGNEFYNDFLLRHGFRYAMGVCLPGGGNEVAMLGFQRRRSDGCWTKPLRGGNGGAVVVLKSRCDLAPHPRDIDDEREVTARWKTCPLSQLRFLTRTMNCIRSI